MKRMILLVLLSALLLTACHGGSKDAEEVTFYYLRSEIAYGSEDSVIAPEVREIPAGEQDLSYLLDLYMQGPTEAALVLPLPAGTQITGHHVEGGTLTVIFSAELSSLEGMDLSIACACIGYTCFSLTNAEAVRIEAPAATFGNPVSCTVTRDTFLLFDDTTVEADAS